MTFFVGQEVVTDKQRAVWSMSYAGGVSSNIADRGQISWRVRISAQGLALRCRKPPARPRPLTLGARQLSLRQYVGGRPLRASPRRLIYLEGMPVYRLRYSGRGIPVEEVQVNVSSSSPRWTRRPVRPCCTRVEERRCICPCTTTTAGVMGPRVQRGRHRENLRPISGTAAGPPATIPCEILWETHLRRYPPRRTAPTWQ